MHSIKASIVTKWGSKGYVPFEVATVTSHMIDTAMDTDTDSWTFQMGDPGNLLTDMLRRDNEVRVNIFAVGKNGLFALNTGFADTITYDHENVWTVTGRDRTAVAVDSQHPPQIWHHIRPHVLVAKEARSLKIGDMLQLARTGEFKTYATDGSESYWQVWYRFYRKKRKWLYAEPDGALIASELDYNASPAYFFGSPKGMTTRRNANWIPVEMLEWRADKTQRVGDVFIFGHRGDLGFVAHAADRSIKGWIKRPTKIISSQEAHNQAEARVEAWEEIFESKVGSVEIKLTIQNPGFAVRQNKMCLVNIPHVGLRGQFFVVGVQMVGNIEQGMYQVVRLRERRFAISRRHPDDPILNAGPLDEGAIISGIGGGIAGALQGIRWADSFVQAAQTYRGPWPFQLFLGVLLSMAEHESGFRNVRQEGDIEWPGTYDGVPAGKPPAGPDHNPMSAPLVYNATAYNKFRSTFANDHGEHGGGVGPVQLTFQPFKVAADKLLDPNNIDELYGGRWDPDSNIKAAAAALAYQLGAGTIITPDGDIRQNQKITGLSLHPVYENIWLGVAGYAGGPSGLAGTNKTALMRAQEVKKIYDDTFKDQVAEAQKAAIVTDATSIEVPSVTGEALRKAVLENSNIKFWHPSEKTDIQMGLISERVLSFLMAFTSAGFPVEIYALKSDHDKYVAGSNPPRISAHWYGHAVDMPNYNSSNMEETRRAMKWIGDHQDQLGFDQLIGPDSTLVIPLGRYDAGTLAAHKSHIHVGWPFTGAGAT